MEKCAITAPAPHTTSAPTEAPTTPHPITSPCFYFTTFTLFWEAVVWFLGTIIQLVYLLKECFLVRLHYRQLFCEERHAHLLVHGSIISKKHRLCCLFLCFVRCCPNCLRRSTPSLCRILEGIRSYQTLSAHFTYKSYRSLCLALPCAIFAACTPVICIGSKNMGKGGVNFRS